MRSVVILVALVLIPFVVMVLWVKGEHAATEAPGLSAYGLLAFFEPPAARIRQSAETAEANEAAKDAARLEEWRARIAEVRAKPKLMAAIDTALADLKQAREDIISWESDGLPLLTASAGRALIDDPVKVEAAANIFNQKRTSRKEIEDYIASLTPFSRDVTKAPAIDVVPLAKGDPAGIEAIDLTAQSTIDSYKEARHALLGLLAECARQKSAPPPDLKSAIERFEQENAAREATEKVIRRHASTQMQPPGR